MDFLTRLLDDGDAVTREARDRARLAICGEPRRTGWGGRLGMLVAGTAIGAAAAMLLDPARGRSRRARFLDQGAGILRRGGREAARLGRRVGSDVEGKVSALRAAGSPSTAPMDDVTIADRVQTELFRDPEVPKGDINVNVERGVVVLRGEVPDDAMRRQLVERVERIEGVWSVRDLLHLPGEPAPTEAVPSLGT